MKRKKGTYYDRNREVVLEKTNQRYKENKKYRLATLIRARDRYHNDDEYREDTINRAKKRYRKLKAQLKKQNKTLN